MCLTRKSAGVPEVCVLQRVCFANKGVLHVLRGSMLKMTDKNVSSKFAVRDPESPRHVARGSVRGSMRGSMRGSVRGSARGSARAKVSYC